MHSQSEDPCRAINKRYSPPRKARSQRRLKLDQVPHQPKFPAVLKVNIHEAKTHLSRYAKRVKAGETILLCDRNQPFAEIRPYGKTGPKKPAKRRMGMDEGKGILTDDWDSAETNAAIAALFGVDEKPAP